MNFRDKLAKFVIIILTVAKAPFSVRDLKKKPIDMKRREVTFNEAEYTRWPRKEYSGPQDDGTCSICPALLHSCLGAARRSDYEIQCLLETAFSKFGAVGLFLLASACFETGWRRRFGGVWAAGWTNGGSGLLRGKDRNDSTFCSRFLLLFCQI